jgi:uncharacterized repeat protein (TIGR01451 family)
MTKSKLLKGLLGATALTAFTAGSAHAVEPANNFTAADTPVSNTFTLTYDVGGVTQPPIDTSDPGDPNGPTVFTVDRLIDLTVESLGDETSAPGSTNEELVYSLQNLGNDDQAYSLTVIEEAATSTTDTEDPADATPVIQYYIDDGDGVYEPGGDDGTLVTYDPANPPVLGPDEVLWVVVTQDIRSDAVDGNTADITLLADTLDPTAPFAETVDDADGNDADAAAAAENVFVDGQGTGNEAATPDGDHSATGTYIVASADISAIKDVAMHSQDGSTCTAIPGTPVAGGYFVPGGCVEYTITVTNSGSDAATDIDVSDTLPAELLFAAADFSGFTGGSLGTLPPVNTDCTGSACVISLTGASLPAPVAPATQTQGVVTIRAYVK